MAAPGPPSHPTDPGEPQYPTYGQLPPPPGQWGQAPPPGQWGQAPPPGQWGQAPPPGQWGQAPPPGQWGQYPGAYPVAPNRDPNATVEAPPALRPVVYLLLTNLGLSVLLTILTVLARHSIIDYQLDHRHITDPDLRNTLRDSYSAGIVGRMVGNIAVSVVYVFLIRALLRGRRWAYRRVIFLGIAGIVGLLLLQITPYPVWMRAEQLAQAVVLGLMLWFVLRPEVKAHFASGLPGRDVRRFGR